MLDVAHLYGNEDGGRKHHSRHGETVLREDVDRDKWLYKHVPISIAEGDRALESCYYDDSSYHY